MNKSGLGKFFLASLTASAMLLSTACTTTQMEGSDNATDSIAESDTATFLWGAGVPQPKAARPAPRPAASGPCRDYTPDIGPDMSASGMAFPTGDRYSSAIMVHQVMPREVRSGADYAYEYHVTNLTNATLQNVVLTAEGANNLSVTSASPAGSKSSSGIFWSLGDLGACETRIIKVNATSADVGLASNCVSVSYNNLLCATLNVVDPALRVSKTATKQALVCDTVVLKYEVCNTGTGVATNVRVRDTLPRGLTTTDGKSVIDVPVGSLAAGECRTLTFNAKAASTGEFSSKASAVADGLTASSAATTTTITKPVLAITADCPEERFIGRSIAFEFGVKNTGDAASANTTVVSMLPSGTEFVKASAGGTNDNGRIVWNLGSLAADANKTVTMTVKPAGPGNYTASATATGACAVAVTDRCSTPVVGRPAILLEVVDTDLIEVGSGETYTITVTNQGTAPGTNIIIVAEIPGEQQYVSSTGATNGTLRGNTLTFAPLASLAPKAVATWKVNIKALKAGDIRFLVRMNSDQLTSPVQETEATNQYE